MQKITTFLWFDTQAEEAANFYCSLFPDSNVTHVSRYGEVGPGEDGKVMTVSFTLAGNEYTALNGGPHYSFTPAISLFVHCKDQAEVDTLWDKLSANGGTPVQCGWITDKFGLSWQIVPDRLMELMSDDDEEKSQRVMDAMLKMVKIDIPTLERAYAGEAA